MVFIIFAGVGLSALPMDFLNDFRKRLSTTGPFTAYAQLLPACLSAHALCMLVTLAFTPVRQSAASFCTTGQISNHDLDAMMKEEKIRIAMEKMAAAQNQQVRLLTAGHVNTQNKLLLPHHNHPLFPTLKHARTHARTHARARTCIGVIMLLV